MAKFYHKANCFDFGSRKSFRTKAIAAEPSDWYLIASNLPTDYESGDYDSDKIKTYLSHVMEPIGGELVSFDGRVARLRFRSLGAARNAVEQKHGSKIYDNLLLIYFERRNKKGKKRGERIPKLADVEKQSNV